MKLNNLFYNAGCLFRLGWGTLVLIAILGLVKHFIFDILPVSGESMYPNFHNRDLFVLNKISYLNEAPKRGDSVVLRFPGDPEHARYIKRLVGLPGEKVSIREGKIYINEKLLDETYIPSDLQTNGFNYPEMTLREGQYYLVGDNRPASSDSRTWGYANKTDFIGKAFFIVLPLSRFQALPQPIYNL